MELLPLTRWVDTSGEEVVVALWTGGDDPLTGWVGVSGKEVVVALETGGGDLSTIVWSRTSRSKGMNCEILLKVSMMFFEAFDMKVNCVVSFLSLSGGSREERKAEVFIGSILICARFGFGHDLSRAKRALALTSKSGIQPPGMQTRERDTKVSCLLDEMIRCKVAGVNIVAIINASSSWLVEGDGPKMNLKDKEFARINRW